MRLIIRQSITFILLEEIVFAFIICLFLSLISEDRYCNVFAFGGEIIRVNGAGLHFGIPLELAFIIFFEGINPVSNFHVLSSLVRIFPTFFLEHTRVGKELKKSVLILERFVKLCLIIRCLQHLQLLIVGAFFPHLTDLFKLNKLISVLIACRLESRQKNIFSQVRCEHSVVS